MHQASLMEQAFSLGLASSTNSGDAPNSLTLKILQKPRGQAVENSHIGHADEQLRYEIREHTDKEQPRASK